MAENFIEEVRRLLRPTHDLTGWYAAVEALDVDRAVPVLLGILNDNLEPVETRGQAALLLGTLGDERAVEPLIEATNSDDGLFRARAVRALGQIGVVNDRVTQQLIHCLHDDDYFVRKSSAKALGQLKSAEALPALEQMSSADSVLANQDVARQAIDDISSGD